MIHSKALMKLLKMTGGVPERHITVNDDSLHIIPDGQFSPEEIEELRSVEEWRQELGYRPTIANFLPDGIRPEGVKKM